jgi:hypothetical protein
MSAKSVKTSEEGRIADLMSVLSVFVRITKNEHAERREK